MKHDLKCEIEMQTMGLLPTMRDPSCHCAQRAYQADPLPDTPWQPTKDPADTPAYNPALTWGMALHTQLPTHEATQ